jgi:hypothetical protein
LTTTFSKCFISADVARGETFSSSCSTSINKKTLRKKKKQVGRDNEGIELNDITI